MSSQSIITPVLSFLTFQFEYELWPHKLLADWIERCDVWRQITYDYTKQIPSTSKADV